MLGARRLLFLSRSNYCIFFKFANRKKMKKYPGQFLQTKSILQFSRLIFFVFQSFFSVTWLGTLLLGWFLASYEQIDVLNPNLTVSGRVSWIKLTFSETRLGNVLWSWFLVNFLQRDALNTNLTFSRLFRTSRIHFCFSSFSLIFLPIFWWKLRQRTAKIAKWIFSVKIAQGIFQIFWG